MTFDIVRTKVVQASGDQIPWTSYNVSRTYGQQPYLFCVHPPPLIPADVGVRFFHNSLTPLHQAAIHGDAAATRYLLELPETNSNATDVVSASGVSLAYFHA